MSEIAVDFNVMWMPSMNPTTVSLTGALIFNLEATALDVNPHDPGPLARRSVHRDNLQLST